MLFLSVRCKRLQWIGLHDSVQLFSERDASEALGKALMYFPPPRQCRTFQRTSALFQSLLLVNSETNNEAIVKSSFIFLSFTVNVGESNLCSDQSVSIALDPAYSEFLFALISNSDQSCYY